jgi:uncharacterized protein (TIGR03083 family)
MKPERLLDCLTNDYTRLRDVAAKDLAPAVPSCPGWTVTDLVRHVAEVYLHKAESMRQQKQPDPWPPSEIDTVEPIALLERAWGELLIEFADRDPESLSYTWYEPDQTVGFWLRRMAQETVIHRIDAELALAQPIQPVADDLAVDGIDEVLTIFLEYASRRWASDFGDDLATADGRLLVVSTGEMAWDARARPDGVEVRPHEPQAETAAAELRADPETMLRWLWGRGGERVAVTGDRELVARLRRLLVVATQ